ncbi:conserved hypothetical protein [[Clostridium] ultunense Esp]|nr:UvrB/UvrC motif-containing protein [Thermicanus aegyptius]CCQ93789.1 conserved hypothetical protein [[Clostridium] ultunense Esp]
MICQQCGVRPATFHFTKIVNGQKTEMHLCEICARERGEMMPGNPDAFSIHNLLSGLLSYNQPHASQVTSRPLQCPTCGLTYQQFTQSGRFGCSGCYHAFEEQLEPLFRRVHGNTIHRGKVPRRSEHKLGLKRKLEDLKRLLARKVEREEFEEAAKIRDQIRELESQSNE